MIFRMVIEFGGVKNGGINKRRSKARCALARLAITEEEAEKFALN